MKRILTFLCILILLLVPFESRENPIVVSCISELLNPRFATWTMEIDYWEIDTLDDWSFQTTSDISGFKPGIIVGSGLVTIVANNLLHAVLLRPGSETIRINSGPFSYPSFLSYSDTGGAMISTPKPGQSICFDRSGRYYLDNSPTIGAPNDTIGACGVLAGTVTTESGAPIPGVTVFSRLWQDTTTTDASGSFTIHDLAVLQDLRFEHPQYKSHWTTCQMWPESTVVLPVKLEPIVSVASAAPVESFRLSQNYPNPFNPVTRIEFTLTHSELVVLDVYTVQGRFVTNLVSEVVGEGLHSVEWDAGDLPSGLYLCRMRAGDFTASQKLLLLR